MKFKKIKKIEKVASEPVYHMTVEKNHNFFGNGLCLHNCSYRGMLKVILINHSERNYKISYGDKIAQIVFAPVLTAEFIMLNVSTGFAPEDDLTETDRGEGGFGSTGLK